MTKPLARSVLLALVLSLTAGCTIKDDRSPAPTAPTPPPMTPTAPQPDLIEFRALGNVNSVVVRTSDTYNGAQIVTTGLPYFTSVTSMRDTVFLSMDVSTLINTQTSPAGAYVQAQIYVNGVLFKEAFDNSSFLPRASVSGTYRRP